VREDQNFSDFVQPLEGILLIKGRAESASKLIEVLPKFDLIREEEKTVHVHFEDNALDFDSNDNESQQSPLSNGSFKRLKPSLKQLQLELNELSYQAPQNTSEQKRAERAKQFKRHLSSRSQWSFHASFCEAISEESEKNSNSSQSV